MVNASMFEIELFCSNKLLSISEMRRPRIFKKFFQAFLTIEVYPEFYSDPRVICACGGANKNVFRGQL
jgi:hypothetical protein